MHECLPKHSHARVFTQTLLILIIINNNNNSNDNNNCCSKCNIKDLFCYLNVSISIMSHCYIIAILNPTVTLLTVNNYTHCVLILTVCYICGSFPAYVGHCIQRQHTSSFIDI